MAQAIRAFKAGTMGYKIAANRFNVPRTTLFRLASQLNTTPDEVVKTKLGRRPVCSPELENKLVDYLLLMEKKFFRLTRRDMKRPAYQLAIANNLPNPFCNNT